MDHKKAATILINVRKKYQLNAEEKEAVETAIGVLSWTSLAKSAVDKRKAKKTKSTEW